MRYDQARFDRFCERHYLDRRALLAIFVFLTGYESKSFVRAALEFSRGEGPAAVAMGREKGRTKR